MKRFLFLLLLSSCVTPPAPIPMRSVTDAYVGNAPAKCLVIFLPGAGDHAEHFTREGFVGALRERKLSVDIISTDATLGYYLRGGIIERLEEDVVGPTRGKYSETWFIGPSMGGHGSLLFPSRKPGSATGVFALAPFLGNGVPDEIEKAGGLKKWSAGEGGGYERELWAWLQKVLVQGEAGPEIWMGFGTADRLAKTDEVMAAAVAPDHVFRAEGGAHNWKTWRGLFEQFLERSSFAQRCAP
ncbi:MAG: hypothetical protein QM817_37170 [Archangium sp.]